MQMFKIPWGQWYEQSFREIFFPDTWKVFYQGIEHERALNKQEIIKKIDEPVGTDKLEVLAAGKKSACILIDDISRPTSGEQLLPIIINKLVNSGMSYGQIKVLIALGGHRPMTKQEMEIKVGSWVMEHVQVLNHSPFASDLVTIQDDNQIIKINRHFFEAELKIAVGCIVPHTLAGFSGGAKAVIPGIGGIETLKSNHELVFADKAESMSFKTSTCNPDNDMRRNMEKIVEKTGLDFIVNVVLNDCMQPVDVFAGHFVKAHRMACIKAKECLKTSLIKDADILVLSAYPKDTEYSQIGTCFAVLGHYKEQCIKKDGTVIAMTAASEGAGFHALFGPGMSLFSPHDDNVPPMEIRGVDTVLFSDGVNRVDIQQYYRNQVPPLYKSWKEILQYLEKKYENRKPIVAIYPMGAIQIGNMDGEIH